MMVGEIDIFHCNSLKEIDMASTAIMGPQCGVVTNNTYQVRSFGNNDNVYDVKVSGTNVVDCSCKARYYNPTVDCKHMKHMDTRLEVARTLEFGDEEREVSSWTTKGKTYTIIGSTWCSCPAFEHGDGSEICKHLKSTVYKPVVIIPSSWTSKSSVVRKMTGEYNILLDAGGPVWKNSESCYLFKSKEHHRWMITHQQSGIESEKGYLRTKQKYLNSKFPPNEVEWQIWSSKACRWFDQSDITVKVN